HLTLNVSNAGPSQADYRLEVATDGWSASRTVTVGGHEQEQVDIPVPADIVTGDELEVTATLHRGDGTGEPLAAPPLTYPVLARDAGAAAEALELLEDDPDAAAGFRAHLAALLVDVTGETEPPDPVDPAPQPTPPSTPTPPAGMRVT